MKFFNRAKPTPRVSVIVSTYNWSSVLRYAIQSVLQQTYRDWELLVIGDGCTDDSEQVAMRFRDRRIRWHNLPSNTGNQSMPNNKGIELARGQLIAYLGHDDLWHPEHLRLLVQAIDHTGANLSYAIGEMIQPLAPIKRALSGLSASGHYEPGQFVPPSTILHRKAAAQDIGGWRDYRTIVLPSDVDFLTRLWQHSGNFAAVPELTVFKFPSAVRPGSYSDKPSHEQESYADRLRNEPEFRYRELLAVVRDPVHVERTFDMRMKFNKRPLPGEIVEGYRQVRGLEEKPAVPAEEVPLYLNPALLTALTFKNDINPFQMRYPLYTKQQLPEDGIFIGFGWHSLEQDEWGRRFRWVDQDAELVFTNPSGHRNVVRVEIEHGPGVGYEPFDIQVVDENDRTVAELTCRDLGVYDLALPVTPGAGALFRLRTSHGGRPTPNDNRTLNFRVFDVQWAADPDRMPESLS